MKSILAAVLLVCGMAPACAEGQAVPSGPMPLEARVIVENESVMVFRTSIPPRGRTPMHDVTPRVVIWLSDAHFVDRYADGHAIEEQRKAGAAEWVSARQHSGENLSDRPMEFIAVVLKSVAGNPDSARPHGH